MIHRPDSWVLFVITFPDGNIRELYTASGVLGRPIWRPRGEKLLVPHYGGGSNRMQLWSVSVPEGVAHRFTHDASDYSVEFDAIRDGTTAVGITGSVEITSLGGFTCGSDSNASDYSR